MPRGAHGLIGLAGLAAAWLLVRADIAWVKTWLYDLTWYSWLLVLDAALQRRTGRSFIFDAPKEFLLLLPWSVFFWLIFEHFNLVLHNWRYLDLPAQIWLRWPGYFIAYATVLPAVFLTERLLKAHGVLTKVRVRPLRRGGWWYNLFFGLGLAMFLLPLAWPRYFFPLVWGAFIFLLEPVNHRFGGRSLMAEWQAGRLDRFCRLLLAGLICGGLWEFFNFWAGAKWVYTIPFVGFLKVFEMPLLGFLGFPPFAVSLAVMYAFIERLRESAGATDQRLGVGPIGRLMTAALWLAYYILVFTAIDRYTVLTYLN